MVVVGDEGSIKMRKLPSLLNMHEMWPGSGDGRGFKMSIKPTCMVQHQLHAPQLYIGYVDSVSSISSTPNSTGHDTSQNALYMMASKELSQVKSWSSSPWIGWWVVIHILHLIAYASPE